MLANHTNLQFFWIENNLSSHALYLTGTMTSSRKVSSNEGCEESRACEEHVSTSGLGYSMWLDFLWRYCIQHTETCSCKKEKERKTHVWTLLSFLINPSHCQLELGTQSQPEVFHASMPSPDLQFTITYHLNMRLECVAHPCLPMWKLRWEQLYFAIRHAKISNSWKLVCVCVCVCVCVFAQAGAQALVLGGDSQVERPGAWTKGAVSGCPGKGTESGPNFHFYARVKNLDKGVKW